MRQLTRVEQREATVALVRGQRRAAASVDLTGDVGTDTARLVALRDGLARDLPLVPEDPHLRLPEGVVDTERDEDDEPEVERIEARRRGGSGAADIDDAMTSALREVLAQVVDEAAGLDLVGFHVDGPVIAAFADSRGQRNWHRVRRFQLDWSLF